MNLTYTSITERVGEDDVNTMDNFENSFVQIQV